MYYLKARLVVFIILLLACEQALQGALGGGVGKGKRDCNYVSGLNISMEKVDAKCWLAEMTVITSLPLACVLQCLFIFMVASTSCWSAEIWHLSRRGGTGEWMWNSNSRDVVASCLPFSRPAARATQRACSQAILLFYFKSRLVVYFGVTITIIIIILFEGKARVYIG